MKGGGPSLGESLDELRQRAEEIRQRAVELARERAFEVFCSLRVVGPPDAGLAWGLAWHRLRVVVENRLARPSYRWSSSKI